MLEFRAQGLALLEHAHGLEVVLPVARDQRQPRLAREGLRQDGRGDLFIEQQPGRQRDLLLPFLSPLARADVEGLKTMNQIAKIDTRLFERVSAFLGAEAAHKRPWHEACSSQPCGPQGRPEQRKRRDRLTNPMAVRSSCASRLDILSNRERS